MYKKQVLAIDIGGTSAKYGYVSHDGCIKNKSNFRTGDMQNLEEFLEALYPVISHAVKQGIREIGIAALGIFHQSGRCLGGVENLAFLEGMNLVELIEAQFPEVTCHIMNDGTAAAVGEYWLGEGRGSESFLCITLGTGIGCAIVVNGKPIQGSHFQSGEIGYSDYQSDKEYLELQYSTQGVLQEAARRMGIASIDGVGFVDKVKKEEPICAKLFDEWMEVLARIIANGVLLLDPDKIIIGGGISGQKDWLCDALEDKVKKRLPEAFRQHIRVKAAKNGNDAGLLGAVETFFRL